MQKMTIEQLHPQAQKKAKSLPNVPIYRHWVLRMVRFFMDVGWMRQPCFPGVSYTDVYVANTKARIYCKDDHDQKSSSTIGVFWIHGGGTIAGNYKMDNHICSRYVEQLDAVVCSVEYRLAPENPFPAGLDDCYDGWQWFVAQAKTLGVDSSRILLAGQSGGGCMAASLVQRVHDAGGIQPLAQLLWCPMLDDRTGANRELDVVEHIVWPNRNNRAAWSWYTGCEAGADEVPENSVPARRKKLSGLPPTWIGVGDMDLLYEESKVYAARLEEAGVEVVFEVVKGWPHGFESVLEGQITEDYFTRHFQAVRYLIEPDSRQALVDEERF